MRHAEQVREEERCWELIESALGSIADNGHEWDEDPAAWVSAQRRLEEARAAEASSTGRR